MKAMDAAREKQEKEECPPESSQLLIEYILLEKQVRLKMPLEVYTVIEIRHLPVTVFK